MSVARILVPVDFSEASRRGLAYAFAAAKAWEAALEVMHACSLPPYVPAGVAVSLVRGDGPSTVAGLAESQAMDQMTQMLAAVPHDEEPLALIENAAPFDAIKVRSAVADLVVMGTHGRTGIDRFFIGSVAEKVVRSIEKPVITVHRESPASFPPKKILVGIDFSQAAKAALGFASQVAERFGSELSLLHVIAGIPALAESELLLIAGAEGGTPTPYHDVAREKVAREMEKFLAEARALGKFDLAIEIGDPARLILDRANEMGADLIALGTRGRGHLSRLAMGSVAERVVRASIIPVLTLHEHA